MMAGAMRPPSLFNRMTTFDKSCKMKDINHYGLHDVDCKIGIVAP